MQHMKTTMNNFLKISHKYKAMFMTATKEINKLHSLRTTDMHKSEFKQNLINNSVMTTIHGIYKQIRVCM